MKVEPDELVKDGRLRDLRVSHEDKQQQLVHLLDTPPVHVEADCLVDEEEDLGGEGEGRVIAEKIEDVY